MKFVKKLVALFIAATVMMTSCPAVFAGIEMSVEDAYAQCAALYPDFVKEITKRGVSEGQIISFLRDVQSYLLNMQTPVTEENFESCILPVITEIMAKIKHIDLRDALIDAYPGAVVDGKDGIISDDFRPLVETVKSIIFGGEEEETTEKPTQATTEAPTVEESTEEIKPTDDPTQTPTEAPTTAPTDSSTDTPTEAPTNTPTEVPTEAPTTGGNTGGTGGGPGGNTGGVPTEKPTSKPDTDDGNTDETAPTENMTETVNIFSDMHLAPWASDAVASLVKSQIVSGYPDGTFKPNNPITRAEFAKIVVVASGRYDKSAKVSFTDVKESDWFYSYVASAYNLGFINGRGDGTFDHSSHITRADICTIAYRFIKSINSEFKPEKTVSFADGDKIPSYALEAVNALAGAGIIGGVGDNKFDPLAPATRAQSAKIIYGSLQAAFGF